MDYHPPPKKASCWTVDEVRSAAHPRARVPPTLQSTLPELLRSAEPVLHAQDDQLRAMVKLHGGRNWKKIAEDLVNKTDVQCLHRWQKVLNPELVKGPWRKEARNPRPAAAAATAAAADAVTAAAASCRELCVSPIP